MPQPVKVFISYSHNDRDACAELQKHLKSLEDNKTIKVWVDSHTLASQEWERPISDELNSAEIIILLLSKHFFNSDYCKNREMKRAFEREENGEVNVVPILYTAYKWDTYPQIKKLTMLPRDAKPVDEWPNRDSVWTNVVNELEKIAKSLGSDGARSGNQRESVTNLIPYLVNRHDQNGLVSKGINEQVDPTKSMLIVAQGQNKDALGAYVEVLCKYEIPGQIAQRETIRSIELLKLSPRVDKEIKPDHNWWTSFNEKMGCGKLEQNSAVEQFNRLIAMNHYLVWFELSTSILGKQPTKALETCLDFVTELKKQLSSGRLSQNPIYMITVEFDESGLINSFFRHRHVKNFLAKCEVGDLDEGFHFVVLPRMESVKQIAVKDWAESERVQKHLSDKWTSSTISTIYSVSEKTIIQSDKGILMDDLAPTLAGYLKSAPTP